MQWSLIADEQQTLDKAKEQQEHRCFFDFSHLVLPAQAGMLWLVFVETVSYMVGDRRAASRADVVVTECCCTVEQR